MIVHDFNERLEFSQGNKIITDKEIIRQSIPKCVNVIKTSEELDRLGIDYIAELTGGAKIYIDVKTREKGASRWWKHNEPELALEIWSVYPDENNKGKQGWTLSNSSNVDLILYTFDKSDCEKFYLLPFQHLRKAFINNCQDWLKKYNRKKQLSESWQSEALFVPVSVVLKAITQTMSGVLA